jgi:hypothetical protein
MFYLKSLVGYEFSVIKWISTTGYTEGQLNSTAYTIVSEYRLVPLNSVLSGNLVQAHASD